MTQAASSGERKQRLVFAFDSIAKNYESLRFVQMPARRLIEMADIPLQARVLDVGTGTGLVALMTASLVGLGGRVVGVDFSSEMLIHARENAKSANLEQVEFVQGDAEHLEFPDASFDVVLFASSLFFVPDMQKALFEAHRVLVPGGLVGFSSFGTGFMSPLSNVLSARLERHGVGLANPPVSRLADPEICKTLLENAGFGGVEVVEEQLGYFYNIEDRWTEIMAGLEGMPIVKLPTDKQEQLKAEHLAELATLETAEGLWMNVPTNFAFGHKAF